MHTYRGVDTPTQTFAHLQRPIHTYTDFDIPIQTITHIHRQLIHLHRPTYTDLPDTLSQTFTQSYTHRPSYTYTNIYTLTQTYILLTHTFMAKKKFKKI